MATKDQPASKPGGEIILYQTEDQKTRVQVRLENETVWLTQAQMAELFQTSVPNVSMHIRNIFAEGELQSESVIKDFLTTAADGKSYRTNHYNLDVIISVGYRVKSQRGTQFRIWATQRLREYIIKGFALDDERLKQVGGGEYFDQLLARIRDIRSSGKAVFRHGAKQNPLGGARSYGGGNHSRAVECQPTEHGANDVDGRGSPARGHRHCQKLSENGRNGCAEPHRDVVSRLCRTTSECSQANVHARFRMKWPSRRRRESLRNTARWRMRSPLWWRSSWKTR